MSLSTKHKISAPALGQIVTLPDQPTSGDYLPTGTTVSRASYPELDAAYPHPKLPSSGYTGLTWTQRTMPTSTTWHDGAFGNGVYVAIALDSTIAATSTNGIFVVNSDGNIAISYSGDPSLARLGDATPNKYMRVK